MSRSQAYAAGFVGCGFMVTMVIVLLLVIVLLQLRCMTPDDIVGTVKHVLTAVGESIR